MPLDTSGIANLHLPKDWDRESNAPESAAPGLQIGPDIGAALKAVREFHRLSLEELADRTRIKRPYLAALEEMRLDELPSRPFTIGYVRAYAQALGLDGEAAVERFKADEPTPDEALRAPVGVQSDRDPRILIMVVAALLIVGAIVLWNIAQRAMKEQAPPPPTAPQVSATPAPVTHGPVSLGEPLPAPVESTIPPPYETPGLEAATAASAAGGTDSAHALAMAKAAAAGKTTVDPSKPPPPAVFVAAGTVYGAPAGASQIVFQARKSTSLIARGANGQPYFARQLAAGEAYRAPMIAGLSVEVIEPDAVQLFVAGQSKGMLPVGQSAVAKFAVPAAPAAPAPAAAAPVTAAAAPATPAAHPAAAAPPPAQ
jgi:cytoskeletal protein RodZ